MPKDLEKLARKFDEHRASEKAAKLKKDSLREDILEELSALGKNVAVVPGYSIEVSQRESNEIDEEYLEQNLPEDVWNSITSSRLDQQKLIQEIQKGNIKLDDLVPATNRAKEIVKKIPHTLKLVPLVGTIEACVQMSDVKVNVTTRQELNGLVVIRTADVDPPFQVAYRHAGITQVLNVKAVKADTPLPAIPVTETKEELSDGW